MMLRYFRKYPKRVSVREPEESNFPDKRQRDGIGGEASVDVAIGGETSVTVDNKPLSALSAHHATRPQFGATLPPQRVHHDYIIDYLTSLFLKV